MCGVRAWALSGVKSINVCLNEDDVIQVPAVKQAGGGLKNEKEILEVYYVCDFSIRADASTGPA